MKNKVFPVVFWQSGIPDIWLCEIKEGTYKPVGKTGPIVLPKDWRDELINQKNREN